MLRLLLEFRKEALACYGKSEIFNTNQGCQLTSQAFTKLMGAHDIRINMDGKGCNQDNFFVNHSGAA